MKSLKVLITAVLATAALTCLISCGGKKLYALNTESIVGSDWITGCWTIDQIYSNDEVNETESFIADVKGNTADSEVIITNGEYKEVCTLEDFVNQLEEYKRDNVIPKDIMDAEITTLRTMGGKASFEGDYDFMVVNEKHIKYEANIKASINGESTTQAFSFHMKKE